MTVSEDEVRKVRGLLSAGATLDWTSSSIATHLGVTKEAVRYLLQHRSRLLTEPGAIEGFIRAAKRMSGKQ